MFNCSTCGRLFPSKPLLDNHKLRFCNNNNPTQNISTSSLNFSDFDLKSGTPSTSNSARGAPMGGNGFGSFVNLNAAAVLEAKKAAGRELKFSEGNDYRNPTLLRLSDALMHH